MTLLACRMYGCTPSELDEQDAETVALHLRFAAAEERVKEAQHKAAQDMK